MEVSRIRALRGPNLWTRLTAIEAVVTCTDHEADLDQIPGFLTQLRATSNLYAPSATKTRSQWRMRLKRSA
jgi:hypothetical protein